MSLHTDGRIERASYLVDSGVTMKEACKAMGVTFHQLQYWRTKNDTIKRRKNTPEEVKKAGLLRAAQGESVSTIAKTLGVTKRTVNRWIEAASSFEHKPGSSTVTKYTVNAETFDTKEEAIAYCVRAMGGITLSTTTTTTTKIVIE